MDDKPRATHCEIFDLVVQASNRAENVCVDHNQKPLFSEFVCWIGPDKYSYQCDWFSNTSLLWFLSTRGKGVTDLQEIPFRLKTTTQTTGFGDKLDKEYNSSTWVLPQKPSIGGKIQSRCYIGPEVLVTRLKNVPEDIIQCTLEVRDIGEMSDIYILTVSLRGS